MLKELLIHYFGCIQESMDDSSLVPLLTNVEVKIEEEEEVDDDDDDPLIILGFDSVYNNPRSNNSSSSTKSLITNPNPGPGLTLKCTTAWRCRKCNVDFSTQTDIIQHVQEKSCIPQGTTPPQPQILEPPSLVQPQPQPTPSPSDDQQNIHQSYLARKRVPQERQARLAKAAENARIRRANETEEQRETRLARLAERKRIRIANETEEEREVRLNKLRMAQRLRLSNETEEQRDARLTKLRQSRKTRVLAETEEEREARLHKMSEYQRNRQKAQLNSISSEDVQINDRMDDSSNSPPPLLLEPTPAAPTRKPKRVESLKPRVSTPNMKHSQHSYTPTPCKICGKYVPLRYIKLHYLHHSELEHEKTGVWSRAEDWIHRTKTQNKVENTNLEDVSKVFSCSACNSSFSQQVLLDMHIRQAHHHDKSSQLQLQCASCSQVFKDMATLKKHTIKVHPPPLPNPQQMNDVKL